MIKCGDADQRWAAELEEENHGLEECAVKLKRQQLASKIKNAIAAPAPGEAAASVANTVRHRVEMDQRVRKVCRACAEEEFDGQIAQRYRLSRRKERAKTMGPIKAAYK